MPAYPSNSLHLTRSFALILSLAFLSLMCTSPARGQANPPPLIEGYITSVESPDSFVVDRHHILVKPQTSLSWAGGKVPPYPANIREALQPGTFVQVQGYTDSHTRDIPAQSISIRADWAHKLSGLGVIDKVISAGPEPVFRADGYPLHITAATDLTFSDQLNSLADVGTNTWVQYEAKRDPSGAIIVSKATFIPGKPSKFKAVPILEYQKWNVDIPASTQKADEDSSPEPNANPGETALPANGTKSATNPTEKKKTRYAGSDSKFHVLDNRALQDRIQRIGMSLIPAFQKTLPKDHPSKIDFRFYAIDNKHYRSEVCSFEGLILIPSTVVDRLKTDDELAAVLADGIAYNLQRQGARLLSVNRSVEAVGVAGDIAGAFVPGLGIATAIGAGVATSKTLTVMEQQRSRVALALMHDAGYDLMQAPEAWRLLSPKHVPSDVDALRYPDISGYQLSIIYMQYSPKAENPATASLR